jgi:hypothetical protein
MQMLQASYTDVQNLLGNKPGENQPAAVTPAPYYGGGYRPGARYSPYGAPPVYSPPPAAAGAASNADSGLYLDRLTNEDRRDDWEMKVMLIVVIDPQPVAGPVAGATP